MMNGKLNNNRYISLIGDITDQLKTHEIVREYKTNNINKNRLDLYRDFIIILCYNLVETYLGEEYIKTNKHKKEHFTWSFNKVCNSFIDEGFDFSKNKELYDYFYEYFRTTMYENDFFELDFLLSYWEDTLELSYDKTKSDLEGMIEIYKIFDKTIENKILENEFQ
jgi:hypothetical protein